MAKKLRFFWRQTNNDPKKYFLDFLKFHIYLFKRKRAPLNNFYSAPLEGEGVGTG